MQWDNSDLARFASKTRREGRCLVWTGYIKPNGYGEFLLRGHKVYAHRFAYEAAHGPDSADDICVLHDCPDGDRKDCVESAHLWAGTNAENAADAGRKGQMASGKDHWSHRDPEKFARVNAPGVKARGERNQNSRLTEAQVRQIRERYAFRKVTYAILAAEYGVSEDTIARVIKRETWAHVT